MLSLALINLTTPGFTANRQFPFLAVLIGVPILLVIIQFMLQRGSSNWQSSRRERHSVRCSSFGPAVAESLACSFSFNEHSNVHQRSHHENASEAHSPRHTPASREASGSTVEPARQNHRNSPATRRRNRPPPM